MSQAFMGLMVLMLANNIFFYHEHDLETGETIRHAHPFLSEEEEQNRDHSENELILLDLITHAQFFLPERVNLAERIFSDYREPNSVVVNPSPDFECGTVLSLRGPPEDYFYIS